MLPAATGLGLAMGRKFRGIRRVRKGEEERKRDAADKLEKGVAVVGAGVAIGVIRYETIPYVIIILAFREIRRSIVSKLASSCSWRRFPSGWDRHCCVLAVRG